MDFRFFLNRVCKLAKRKKENSYKFKSKETPTTHLPPAQLWNQLRIFLLFSESPMNQDASSAMHMILIDQKLTEVNEILHGQEQQMLSGLHEYVFDEEEAFLVVNLNPHIFHPEMDSNYHIG